MTDCRHQWGGIAWLAAALLCVPLGSKTLKDLPVSLPNSAQGLAYGDPVDPNCLSAKQWEVLPRIGPKLAEQIVQHRRRKEGFKKVPELLAVRGIGDHTLGTISMYLKIHNDPHNRCLKE